MTGQKAAARLLRGDFAAQPVADDFFGRFGNPQPFKGQVGLGYGQILIGAMFLPEGFGFDHQAR